MIYADNACDPPGVRQRPGVQRLRPCGRPGRLPGALALQPRRPGAPAAARRAPRYVGVWDDHEVMNDFGPLRTPGLAAVHARGPPAAARPRGLPRLHPGRRGRGHAEAPLSLVALGEARGAVRARHAAVPRRRTAPRTPQPPEDDARPRAARVAEGRPAASDATWKVIVSSVPMSIPTGFPAANGRDGWANFDQAPASSTSCSTSCAAARPGRPPRLDHDRRAFRRGVSLPPRSADPGLRRPRARRQGR